MQDLTALCVGDAVVDIFLTIPGDNPHFGLDNKENKLFISYGEKIIVEKYEIEMGGNANNTAVGLARLGVETALAAEIGKDEFAKKIIDNLKSENVDPSFVLETPSEKTSFSVGINYKGERTLFVEHVERTHNFKFPENKPKLVYLTSLGKIWEKAYLDVLEFSQKENCLLAFNPGTAQLEERGNVLWSTLEETDILFVNKEEAQEILYGKEIDLGKIDKSIKKLLYGLKGLGPKQVVITDSANGSYLEDKQNSVYHLGILDTKVVEKTGAGDSYNAGFLAATVKGLDSSQAMVWGTVNSASVIGEIGAQKGLLTEKQIKEKIENLKDFSPEEL
jgi:ribokinase